jgi:hypothetical protein
MAKQDENNESSGTSRPSQENEPQGKARRRGRLITPNDAGWITPTAFVAPLTFVSVDPPRPIKKSSSPAD